MDQLTKNESVISTGINFVSGLRWWSCVIPALAVASFGTVARAQGQPSEDSLKAQNVALDGNFYTSYGFTTDRAYVYWVVAGQTEKGFDGYGSGTLGPFGRVAALLESDPWTDFSKKIVTRFIYVLDVGFGSNQNGVVLYAYKKIDRISSLSDKAKVTLANATGLPLAGGSSVSASMAANTNYIYIGTNQSSQAVRVTKKDFAIRLVGKVDPSVGVSSITANPYGYVTVTVGKLPDAGCVFRLYGPDGSEQEYGGGTPFILNSTQAVLPADLP